MTGPHSDTDSTETRPISVAELLARNGTLGAPAVTRRRRRRRGDSDSVTVAELTGEIPVIRDDHDEPAPADGEAEPVPEPLAQRSSDDVLPADVVPDRPPTAYWSEPEPRWPKSPPQPKREAGPERSAYPRPLGRDDAAESNGAGRKSGAEGMSPDPVDHYAGTPVDALDAELDDAGPAEGESVYLRSYLHASDSALLDDDEAPLDDEPPTVMSVAEDDLDGRYPGGEAADEPRGVHSLRSTVESLRSGSVVVLQSVLAVGFGAGLFVAFDELWRWNSIVALVLSVLVIIGLVVGVRVVRKTEDIASTLIAVAVGALITLGPLALSLQSG